MLSLLCLFLALVVSNSYLDGGTLVPFAPVLGHWLHVAFSFRFSYRGVVGIFHLFFFLFFL